MTTFYPAIIERAGDAYSVFFPDLPGCTSAGDSIEQAHAMAEEALGAHLSLMASHGEEIPSPSTAEGIERDPDVDEVAREMIEAKLA